MGIRSVSILFVTVIAYDTERLNTTEYSGFVIYIMYPKILFSYSFSLYLYIYMYVCIKKDREKWYMNINFMYI
ncbi:hypothetical protein HanIR_Chr11g0555411 [Helianthus annuus]|nr:hypothetical protein HanIR_Chr11g0555411 [Helianthus annuus]